MSSSLSDSHSHVGWGHSHRRSVIETTAHDDADAQRCTDQHSQGIDVPLTTDGRGDKEGEREVFPSSARVCLPPDRGDELDRYVKS